MMSLFKVVYLLTINFLLGSCSGPGTTPDYRYRLTVEVGTPDGLKTGSSVIEVEQSLGRSAGTGFGNRINRRAR